MSMLPVYNYSFFEKVDSNFVANSLMKFTGDLNKDGHVDLLVLGLDWPSSQSDLRPWSAQPGRLFLGDGLGGFTLAPESLFPINQLLTVHPREVLIADFNADGQNDLFIADHGWDANPFPGFQNQLFLSTPSGGWRYASDQLPQISDFTHAAAAADIDRDGDLDIFAGNGYGKIPPYFLMNDGTGHFVRDDTRLPNATGEILDTVTRITHFAGAEFADLDQDGWADLILTAAAAQPYEQFRNTTVFWNQQGRFVQGQVTQLPQPARPESRSDMEVGIADFDGDGLKDIVLVGSTGTADGSFVQLFKSLGNRQFDDVSASRLPQEFREILPTDDTRINKPWPIWVTVFDYNGDLASDFYMEFSGAGAGDSTPVVWLNDGMGGFSVVTPGQLVNPGYEGQFAYGRLYQTSAGLQWVGPAMEKSDHSLLLNRMVTTTAYIGRPGDDAAESLTGNNNRNYFVGGGGNDTIDGAGGIDFATYTSHSGNYQILVKENSILEISARSGGEGIDSLLNIERLKFSDGMMAFDLTGNAGIVVKILGAVFGAAATQVREYVGIGLHYADGGMSYEALVQLAIDARLGANVSHSAVVDLLYTNVVGMPPPEADRAHFVGLLDNQTFTVAGLGVFAADFELNLTNIDLVGLAQQGLEYVPYAGP
ncbi:MAG: FG-GAP-like repeat-containing protein [Methylococcaceae bacterium]|nr:FG-GAP-like repeat-containing protein [Methylococcaceae bacterium]